ncbi:unnamed protein product [Cochlearia groenlandica]
MSELPLSSPEEYPNGKKIGFGSLLLSDFHLFCSFIITHPFYCSYLLFFSPYIFKILSFISPLFVTTTLLLLALLSTLYVNDACPGSESLETQPSFLFSFCNKLGSVLEPNFDVNDEDSMLFDELEAYTMALEACSNECVSEEEKSKAQKVEVVGEVEKKNKVSENEKEEEKEGDGDGDVSLKSFGSMRKEKEWRRTLACKLFEERHNADVGQGMDQLWETYETETEKKQTEDERKKKEKKTTKSMMMMKTKSIDKKKKKKKEEVVVEEEEDEDGIDQQQLCCLQALKFSTGKRHLGISRPNLVKLTKAFKGFGRFYNAHKHHKKAD